ncbi:MAG: ESX secretion-associated protein EspG [Saccharothrix sp.]|nr:ESX secretion-associated protein EspG [Saccharothrix sp.]
MVWERIVCSFAELDLIGEALRITLRRFPFVIPHYGATLEERVRLVGSVHRDLVARRLIRGGEFAPELVEALRVFAGGRLVIALVGASGGTRLAAVAVADDRAGVVAEQQGEAVAFRPCGPDAVVPDLLRLLPPMRPGPGTSVTVAGATPRARSRLVEEDFSEATFRKPVKAAASSPAGQRDAAERILRRPRLGAGYFVVSGRARDGRHAEVGTIGFLDTDAGRYAVTPAVMSDGRRTATYVPADQAVLDRHLKRLIDRYR